VARVIEQLRELALRYPGAWEDHPWEEDVVKVGKKIFVFFGQVDEHGQHHYLGVKIPQSVEMALTLDYVRPTPYGLGKAGWVSISDPPDDAPWDLFGDWIEESYRAVAPKRLLRELGS
jgi:predicted DNA-binding protein (MmcQ/YjbR family)